jgi:hypothetical protein
MDKEQAESFKTFIKELTELSIKHGIGINDDCSLYEMNPHPIDGDYERQYSIDENWKLSFR